MASEETALLLESDAATKHEAVYRRFSSRQKKVILAIVAWSGLIPLFVSGTFVPSIPQIAKDLNTTGPVINITVSLSIFAASIGALFGSTYSSYYGRRPIYLFCLPLLFIGSIGVALAQSVHTLMIWRFLQSFGASPGMSVGAGVIGDIYKLEERGQAMGIYFAACLLGPALAPPIGGFTAHYATWRIMQLTLAVMGLSAFLCILFYFPETSHPGARGVDKLETNGETRSSWRLKLINPLSPLYLLRSPNLLAVSVSGFFILLTDYVLLIPLAYTIGVRYNITNEALIGACFLPVGVGNMIGAPLAGRMSDRIVVHWRAKRGGVWYPEDRLRTALWGASLVVPLSILCSGSLTRFVGGPIGLGLNLVCLFANGVGVDIVLSPSAAYVVDVMHSRSAESMAANNSFRAILMSAAIAGILPMINTYGVLITCIVSALLAWIGFLLLWMTIRYGEQMRSWVDVGYSNANTN